MSRMRPQAFMGICIMGALAGFFAHIGASELAAASLGGIAPIVMRIIDVERQQRDEE